MPADQASLDFETSNRTAVLMALMGRIGAEKGISGRDLAALVDIPERAVRDAVTALREEGIAVCARPSSGYFIAANAEELEECCAFLRERAMHSLRLESRLRKIPLVDLIGQLHLPT